MTVRCSLADFLSDITSTNPADLRVMVTSGPFRQDSGHAAGSPEWFGADLARLHVGASLGEDWARGCYDRWPVYLDGAVVAHLHADASGYTLFEAPNADD